LPEVKIWSIQFPEETIFDMAISYFTDQKENRK
jgi:hypothetical protein